MATSSAGVALAGGVGAAVGASLGQVVQWWRDRVHTAIEDHRRGEDRDDALTRERREARREACEQIGGALISIGDYTTALRPYALTLSTPEPQWDTAEPMFAWVGRHLAAAETFATLSRITSIYGSESLLQAVRYLTRNYPTLAPPSKFRDSEGHYSHRVTQSGQTTPISLASFDRPDQLRDWSLTAATIAGQVTAWILGRLRHEMAGEPEPDQLPFSLRQVG